MIVRPQPESITPKPGELTNMISASPPGTTSSADWARLWRRRSRTLHAGNSVSHSTAATKFSVNGSTKATPASEVLDWDEALELLPLPFPELLHSPDQWPTWLHLWQRVRLFSSSISTLYDLFRSDAAPNLRDLWRRPSSLRLSFHEMANASATSPSSLDI